MTEKLPTVMEVLLKAFVESKGETVDVVIEHPELCGVTSEMLSWWDSFERDIVYYKMWCPEDHVSFEWEVRPGEEGKGGIGLAEERIGEFPASVLRLRLGDGGWTEFIGPNEEPIAWLRHDRKKTPNGTKMKSTFRFPARTPLRFLDAMRKHCLTEMGHLPEFLPSLYKCKTIENFNKS
jgi:hypothetical protein